MTHWLAEKALLAGLNVSQWSGRRLDRKITDEVNESHNAVSDAGRYNKLLIPKGAIDPIQKIVGEARVLHIKMTQPWSDSGQRLLPAALYIDYTDKVALLKKAFDRAVDDFCLAYPDHVAQRRKDLNGLFKESDYPPADRIRSKFDFRVTFLPCPDAEDFRVDLAKEHAEDIRSGIEQHLKNTLEEAMREPVRRIIETVGHVVDRLRAYKPSEVPGERPQGIFRDSLIENVRELVTLLPAFNLTNNPTITSLTARMQDELCGEDPEVLRKNDVVRDSVAKSAEEILAEAQAFIA